MRKTGAVDGKRGFRAGREESRRPREGRRGAEPGPWPVFSPDAAASKVPPGYIIS